MGNMLDLLAAAGARVDPVNRLVNLYKGVPADGVTGRQYGRPISWSLGMASVAGDYDPDWAGEGRGLHLSPTRAGAIDHYGRLYPVTAGVLYECAVRVDQCRPVDGDPSQFRCHWATVTRLIESWVA